MAQRRTLEAALSKSQPGVEAEVVKAFVKQGADERQATEGDTATDEIQNRSARSDAVRATSAVTASYTRFQPTGLVPVTIRLQPSVAGALKRASLERELAGEYLYTQQEIVESTLAVWLKANGYLPTAEEKPSRPRNAKTDS